MAGEADFGGDLAHRAGGGIAGVHSKRGGEALNTAAGTVFLDRWQACKQRECWSFCSMVRQMVCGMAHVREVGNFFIEDSHRDAMQFFKVDYVAFGAIFRNSKFLAVFRISKTVSFVKL